jgi:hypothetical protein
VALTTPCGLLLAALGSAPSDEQLNRFLTYYYLDPDPIQAVEYLGPLNELYDRMASTSLGEQADRGGVRSFYSEVFRSSPDAVELVERSMDELPVDVQVFVQEALRRCDTRSCERFRGSPFHPPSTKQDSSLLDDHWAAFNATGDRRHIDAIIQALAWIEVRGDTRRS